MHLLDINEIAKKAGIPAEYVEPYGKLKAKVDMKYFDEIKDRPDGKLVLVTAITPTKAGEGKTTTSVALAEGFGQIGQEAMLCLREPSLGPVFGIKGGATGGGKVTVDGKTGYVGKKYISVGKSSSSSSKSSNSNSSRKKCFS